jgi:hypothetical protein
MNDSLMTGLAAPPPREELLELYRIAVEEYRFQVKLNADRSRDYVVVNSAIIAAGVALLGQARLPLSAGGVFTIGLFVAVLSVMGTHTQHGYYRDTRNRQTQLANQLGFSGLVSIKTKPTGSRYRRFGSVTTVNYVILTLLCLVDLMGALSGFGVIPRPKDPQAVTKASTGPKSAVPRNAAPAALRRSSPGPARPSSATPPPP